MFIDIWKKFPNYVQPGTMDCGATCLRIICAYYGKRYDIDYIRKLCSQSKNGVSLLGIKKAATSLGFNAMGVKCSLDDLQALPLPCILHWNQSHFVVLYKINHKKNNTIFHISDPVGYRFKYTIDELIQCWLNSESKTGMALCLEPTTGEKSSHFNKTINKKDNNIEWMLKHLWNYKSMIYNMVFGMFICAVLLFVFPFFTQSIIDFGVAHKSISFVVTILIAQIVLILSSNLVEFIRNWLLLHIGMKLNISIISDFIFKLTNLPIAFFDSKMTGDIIQRIGDHARIKDFLTDTSLNFIFSIFTFTVFSFILALYNRFVFTVFLIGSVLYIIWILFFMKKRAILDHKMFAQNAATQSNIYELIFGMQEIKLNSCEDQKRWQWEKIQVKIYKILEKGLALSQYQVSGGIIINQTKNAVITAFVATYAIKGEMTLGMLISIQFIIGQLNGPIEQFASFLRKFQDAKLSIQRLNDIYHIQDEIIQQDNLISSFENGSIVFDNVYFKYDKYAADDIIKGISFSAPVGKCTAIVGLSGSGKTTILKMILGFYKPDKGNIYIGSNNITKYNISEWRKKCGVVMQDGFIFSDTIASNISAGKTSDIDMDRVIKAARIANVDKLIESLPEGYSTKIGNDGQGLSMGQKQRILIARAIYKNPDYILLDEATNSLDANNEAEIMNSLSSFSGGKTSIIIAHRLSTVRSADKIIVLDSGQIAEEGCHDELIEKRGLYYTLVKNQLNI